MQSSKPLYLVAAVYLALGAYHYAKGADLTMTLPLPSRYILGRDADADIRLGLATAKADGRRVLIEVGGDWCSWCDRMDEYFAKNPDLATLRDHNFVLVKVATEPGRYVPPALRRFPVIPGYPHLFVLDEKGALVQSKDTNELELGDSYDRDKFIRFLYETGPYHGNAVAEAPAASTQAVAAAPAR
jgi:hypothetical protein